MQKYIFNENGVCTNPDKIGEGILQGIQSKNYIEVAQAANGLWGYGLFMYVTFDQVDAGGTGHGVRVIDCTYSSKESAIYAACQYLKTIADEQDTKQTHRYYVATRNGCDGYRSSV